MKPNSLWETPSHPASWTTWVLDRTWTSASLPGTGPIWLSRTKLRKQKESGKVTFDDNTNWKYQSTLPKTRHELQYELTSRPHLLRLNWKCWSKGFGEHTCGGGREVAKVQIRSQKGASIFCLRQGNYDYQRGTTEILKMIRRPVEIVSESVIATTRTDEAMDTA